MFLVQNTREIAKAAFKHHEKKLATEYFKRWQNIRFFIEKLHDGKEIFMNLMLQDSTKLFLNILNICFYFKGSTIFGVIFYRTCIFLIMNGR